MSMLIYINGNLKQTRKYIQYIQTICTLPNKKANNNIHKKEKLNKSNNRTHKH